MQMAWCSSTDAETRETNKTPTSTCSYLVEAGPPCAALELGGRRVRREVAHGAVEGALPLGVVLDAVREAPGEGRFRASTDDIALFDAQLSLLEFFLFVFLRWTILGGVVITGAKKRAG